MKRLIVACLISLAVVAHAGKPVKDRDLGAKLASRAVDLVGDGGGYIHDIPPSPRRDESGLARYLAKRMVWYRDYGRQKRAKDAPVIVISDDPAVAARVARLAFSSLRAGSLRGLRVICIIGKQYDSYLRSVANVTGAKLQVEALPP